MTSTQSILEQANALLKKHSKNSTTPDDDYKFKPSEELWINQIFLDHRYIDPDSIDGKNRKNQIIKFKNYLVKKYGQKQFDNQLNFTHDQFVKEMSYWVARADAL